MILPDVRTSFGRGEAAQLVQLLAQHGEDAEEWKRTLAERGIDPLLDHPLLADAILEGPGMSPLPLEVVSYILLRRCLLDANVEDRLLADYATSLFIHFGASGRAQRIAQYDDQEYVYLVDIVGELSDAEGPRAFLLRAHLGNLSLWLSGLFPDWIDHRVHRSGGPPLDYYEQMGRTGFSLAAEDPHARRNSLDEMFRSVAGHFVPMRRALNGFSDRFLTPRAKSPVDRILRQVRDGFDTRRLQA
jgi:hypothetical protein